MKLQEQEYFAVRAPHVAQARNKAERDRAIARLAEAPPGSPEKTTHEDFEKAKHLTDAVSAFCHTKARFPLTGVGDVNTYALFAETFYRSICRAGRLGVVLPVGIATDDSTKQFFEDIVTAGRLVRLAAYENEERIFPGVHHAFRFCLLTIAGAAVNAPAELSFFARQPLQVHDARRRFSLTALEFTLLNPNTRTCPIFRSAQDAELTKKICRHVPVLIEDAKPEVEGNPWGVSFMAMIHMANDSELFRDHPGAETLPLYEAKMVHQFNHRWATFGAVDGGREMEARPLTEAERADSAFSVRPRYWVDRGEVIERLQGKGWVHQWLFGWRDITLSTNERTVIAGVVPLVAAGDTFLLMFPSRHEIALVACLLGDQNSLVHDYVARQKVGGSHLKYHVKKQLPTLPPAAYDRAAIEFLVPRVLELTYTATDLAAWAEALGHRGPPFRWDPDRRAYLRAELDAFFARLYGLTRDDLRYVLDPADVMGPDYPSETFRVLKQNEAREFGEYRTRRLVLQAWDRLFGA